MRSITFKKINSFFIVLIPILSYYRFFVSGFTIADFIMISLIFANFIRNVLTYAKVKKFNKSYKGYIYWIIYGLLISILVILTGDVYDLSLVIKRSVKLILYAFFLLSILSNNFDYQYFKKYYKIIGYISVIGLVFQYIGYYIFKRYITFILPFLSLSSESANSFDYISSRLSAFRPDSFFLEPSHYSYFLVVLVIITIFDTNESKIKTLIFSLAMILTTSSSSIILLPIIIVYFLYTLMKSNVTTIRRKVSISLSAIIVIFFVVFLLNELNALYAFERLNIFSDRFIESSVWQKLFIGNSVLDNLTPFNLIIGNGFGNFNQAIFINSNVFILYSTGIVGMTIYLTFLARNYIHNNDIGRLTIIILIAISFAWYIVYSPFLIPFIVVIISEKQKRKFDIVRRY